MKVGQWLSAPLAHIERGERESFNQALYEDELDMPSSCDCGVLALCFRHRQASS